MALIRVSTLKNGLISNIKEDNKMDNTKRTADIKALMDKESYNFYDLVKIMELLRSEGGCPWDREQTHKSIRNNFIEETYEVIEAIDTDDKKLLREELGDVLLQVVFHTRMEEEVGEFNIDDVANDICAKLIHRHPHIFADVVADNTEDVLRNWEQIKNQEKQRVTYTDKLNAIPKMFPALMRAQKVGKKASFFDFESSDLVIQKIYEETEEVKDAIAKGDKENIEEEIGDLLLTVTSLARKAGVDCEQALSKATDKFINRFEKVENKVTEMGCEIDKMSMTELDAVWDTIKHS